MKQFEAGDQVYIVSAEKAQEWVGFAATVSDTQTVPGCIHLYPLKNRPDGHGLTPFYWTANDLRHNEQATTPEEPSEAESGHPEDSQRGADLAHGERLAEYGPPDVSFERIGEFWTIYLEGIAREAGLDPNGVPDITPQDVSMMMILLKVSRTITDEKPDTLDDIDGYTECIRMIRAAETLEVN